MKQTTLKENVANPRDSTHSPAPSGASFSSRRKEATIELFASEHSTDSDDDKSTGSSTEVKLIQLANRLGSYEADIVQALTQIKPHCRRPPAGSVAASEFKWYKENPSIIRQQ
ncbi:unnamed protein product [Cyprideis torosa]|uniref:Uncharacterized protein n=1 Tax=Cyprideis torosa TaxID=163714 RepID=A0A7R8WN06_9CRUS|nr:unnamed protein product [Cyprideis torosa]CAG0900057.1 unnamed protein product [Cyprideis torosa]